MFVAKSRDITYFPGTSNNMQIATRDQIVYRFDKVHPPVLEIDSGETVRIETYDARTGTIQSNDDLLDHPHPIGVNPATGPITIRDSEPGDSLTVELQKIDLAPAGFLAVKKGVGLLGNLAEKYATRIVPIENDIVCFSQHIQFPVRPMVGVVGTAPAGDGIETAYPGPHGGNMDNHYLTTGAKIHLPVFVPGASLAMGDVHASMGDGEITMIGLEICAELTVRISLQKGVAISRPRIETANDWVTTGDAMDPSQALKIAAEEMVCLLQQKFQITFEEAYMLMSARADVQICQICDPGKFPVTTRAVFPRLEPLGRAIT